MDLRLANRKVLKALAKVGALNCFGHPAQILLGLDDALAAGQAAQRDRISGQTSLFDIGGDEAATLERPLPATPETPVRERLRWEKELLGLYLSDHPMGEVAERVGKYVTAYSGDLRDESLDGQRVVLGGIVTGVRSVMTKARATMAVVTLEDLQGTLEVVVFPKTYETTMGTWRDGAILLVAGRVDHRGDEASLLADSVWDWDAAEERGPEAFAREVGSLDKRARRGSGSGHNGGANGGANGGVSPATPVPTYSEPPGLVSAARADGTEGAEEPPLPRGGRGTGRPTPRPRPDPSRRLPVPCSTSASLAAPARTASCPRCTRSRRCSASDRGRRVWSCTYPRPAAMRSPWSCGASLTTRS